MRGANQDEQPWDLIETLEKQLLDMKNGSQHVGGSNIIYYTSESGAAYDWSGVLPTDPNATSQGRRTLIVYVSPSNAAAELFVSLTAKLYKGSPSNWYRPSNRLADAEVGAVTSSLTIRPHGIPAPSGSEFEVVIIGTKTDTYYAKFWASGSARASMAVTEVA